MKDIKIYTHFYKNYPFYLSDLYFPISNEEGVSNPKCKIAPKYIKNLKLQLNNIDISLDNFDSYIYIGDSEKEAEYVGINDYRRYPDFLSNSFDPKVIDTKQETFKYLTSINQKQKALELLKQYDVLTYYPTTIYQISYIDQWNLYHPSKAFNILIEELFKTEYKLSIDFFYLKRDLIFTSPLITKWENISNFSKFYKFIINKLLQRKDFIELFNKPSKSQRFHNKRLLSGLGERLIPFWCYHNKLNIGYVTLIATENIWANWPKEISD